MDKLKNDFIELFIKGEGELPSLGLYTVKLSSL